MSVDDVGANPPTHLVRRFEQSRVDASALQVGRADQSSQAGTHDDHICPFDHEISLRGMEQQNGPHP
ncbi:hypothetical protein GCM10007304_38250 [Rhodococcoides trifolii]|uniref:Uncharacterized protein n=1 Tax=Rhodococcoides trifolii TaxID=908250 RepID=A0A917G3Y9_9NOCA|nr:hypothetical protein GCM10007304_38250 [Rhodococcus trifolii]